MEFQSTIYDLFNMCVNYSFCLIHPLNNVTLGLRGKSLQWWTEQFTLLVLALSGNEKNRALVVAADADKTGVSLFETRGEQIFVLSRKGRTWGKNFGLVTPAR